MTRHNAEIRYSCDGKAVKIIAGKVVEVDCEESVALTRSENLTEYDWRAVGYKHYCWNCKMDLVES